MVMHNKDIESKNQTIGQETNSNLIMFWGQSVKRNRMIQDTLDVSQQEDKTTRGNHNIQRAHGPGHRERSLIK